jgi:uncharacterized membrane protein required for colicin V production
MNWLDWVIIVSLGIGGLLGWRTGIIKVAFGIVGILLGIFAAGRAGASVGDAMTFIESANLATLAGYGVVLLAGFAAAMAMASIVRKFLRLVLLG